MSRIVLSEKTRELLQRIISRDITKYRVDVAEALLRLDEGATYDDVVDEGIITKKEARFLQKELYGRISINEVLNRFVYKTSGLPIKESDIPTLLDIVEDNDSSDLVKKYAKVLLLIADGLDSNEVSEKLSYTESGVINVHKMYSYNGMSRAFIKMSREQKRKYGIAEVPKNDTGSL